MASGALIGRWTRGDGYEAAREVLRRLAGGTPLDDLPLGTVDGLLDLRGLPAGGLHTDGAVVAGADLSHASLFDAYLAGVHWRGCRFDGADLSRTALAGGSMAGCSLRRADLRDLIVNRATWTGVDLTRAKARHLTAERTTFTRVAFPALADAGLTRCSFHDCRFGALSEVQFLGRSHDDDPAPSVLRRVTFASDDIRWAEFDGMEFDEVTFADRDSLLVVPRGFRAVAERAGTLSLRRTDDVGRAFRRLLSQESVQRPGSTASAGWAIARRDLDSEELAAFAAGVLAEAQDQLRDEGVIP